MAKSLTLKLKCGIIGLFDWLHLKYVVKERSMKKNWYKSWGVFPALAIYALFIVLITQKAVFVWGSPLPIFIHLVLSVFLGVGGLTLSFLGTGMPDKFPWKVIWLMAVYYGFFVVMATLILK